MCDSAEKEIADQADFHVSMIQEILTGKNRKKKAEIHRLSLDIQQIWKIVII